MDKRSGNNAVVRAVIIAVLVIIALGTTAIAAAPYLRERLGGSSSESQPALSENGGVPESGGQQESDAWKGESNEGLVTYNGKKYRYNSHLSNYLLLGIRARSRRRRRHSAAVSRTRSSLSPMIARRRQRRFWLFPGIP